MAGFIRLNSPRNLTDFMEHLDFWLIHWRARQSKAYCRSLVTSQQKTHSDFVVTQKRGRKEQPKKAIMVHNLPETWKIFRVTRDMKIKTYGLAVRNHEKFLTRHRRSGTFDRFGNHQLSKSLICPSCLRHLITWS